MTKAFTKSLTKAFTENFIKKTLQHFRNYSSHSKIWILFLLMTSLFHLPPLINWKHTLKSWKTYSQKALQVVVVIFLRCFYWVKHIKRRHKPWRRREKIILWTCLNNLVCFWNLMDSTSFDEQFSPPKFFLLFITEPLCGFRLKAYLLLLCGFERRKTILGKPKSF